MIRQALKLHPKLEVLETDDVSFTVSRTLPRLELQFPGAQLVFLMGSDIVAHLHSWPNADLLLRRSELAVGLRTDASWHDVRLRLSALPTSHDRVHIVESFAPDVSSKQVRQGLRERRYVRGLLSSVAHYSNRNWLYISLS
jgi:nicotinic acid mononucleotide adenylyltransferase